MAKVKRKTKEEQASVDLYSICDGKLNDVREYLDSLAEQYGEDARLCLDWYYDDVSVCVKYQREETEQEATKRVAAARKARERRKAQKLKKEEAERAMLAKLKQKYGEE